jgi:ABC-type methionine transport system ATPase subunit
LGKIGIIHQGEEMSPLTQEQMNEIAKKAEYEAQKERLVKKRKALLADLEYAQDSLEEGLIEEERARLAKDIKTLVANLKQIESWENLA